jgi:SLA1 homology domain 1, SHD1
MNFQASSIDTLRQCPACGLQFVLRAPPFSIFGCVAKLVALLVVGGVALAACGGVILLVGFSSSATVPAATAKATAETSDSEPEPRPAVAETKPTTHGAKWRHWTDKTGKFSTEARFGGMAGDAVILHKPDGATIKVQVDQLSDADKEWLEAGNNGH